MTDVDLVHVSQIDYLDEDKPIRGQNYVCLSFISPEDVLIDKNIYFFNKFISTLSDNLKQLIEGMRNKYPDDSDLFDLFLDNNAHYLNVKELQDQYEFYKSTNSEDLEYEFHKFQNYKPTVRGIKVRGTFDTLKEAQNRAEILKKMGDKFDIFVAQVGCWCPWSPNPNSLTDQEYAETSLNTLMKKYKENIENKDIEYAERKKEKMENINKENEKKKAMFAETASTVADTLEATTINN